MSLSSFLCLPVINQIPSATFSDISHQLLLLYLLKGLALLSDIYLLLYTGSIHWGIVWPTPIDKGNLYTKRGFLGVKFVEVKITIFFSGVFKYIRLQICHTSIYISVITDFYTSHILKA